VARTSAPPVDDPRLWRLALSLAHPDSQRYDSHELFVWLTAIREHIQEGESGTRVPICSRCSGGRTPNPESQNSAWPPNSEPEDKARIPFDDFAALDPVVLNIRARDSAHDASALVAELLCVLSATPPVEHGRVALKWMRGATLKQCGYAAYLAHLQGEEKQEFYVALRAIPCSEAQISWLIDHLKKGEAYG
jgi:hypothetical protein